MNSIQARKLAIESDYKEIIGKIKQQSAAGIHHLELHYIPHKEVIRKLEDAGFKQEAKKEWRRFYEYSITWD